MNIYMDAAIACACGAASAWVASTFVRGGRGVRKYVKRKGGELKGVKRRPASRGWMSLVDRQVYTFRYEADGEIRRAEAVCGPVSPFRVVSDEMITGREGTDKA